MQINLKPCELHTGETHLYTMRFYFQATNYRWKCQRLRCRHVSCILVRQTLCWQYKRGQSETTTSTFFLSLVRPILEYVAPFWTPYLINNIESIEKVQRIASRLALKQKRGDMNYEDHCRVRNGQFQEKQRQVLSLIFKIS